MSDEPRSAKVSQPGISIVEYKAAGFAQNVIPQVVGRTLYELHRNVFDISFPSYRTGGQWIIQAKGVVGHVLLPGGFRLTVEPRTPVANLFRMLDEGGDQGNLLRLFPGLITSQSIPELFDTIARILAGRMLRRLQRGVARAYESIDDRLPMVRGQIDLNQVLTSPLDPRVPCRFDEHTADYADNQIVTWTLFVLIRSGICNSSLPLVRRVYRLMRSLTSLRTYSASDCRNRRYSRLTADYRDLHALCAFILSQAGPLHGEGSQAMVPFLISMPELFERFVSAWIYFHLPKAYWLDAQQITTLDQITLKVDGVLRDRLTREVRVVFDTKYKDSIKPADIYQVVTYATHYGCRDAFLIYPTTDIPPLDVMIGPIRVRSAAFSLAGDLDVAGQELLRQLLAWTAQPSLV